MSEIIAPADHMNATGTVLLTSCQLRVLVEAVTARPRFGHRFGGGNEVCVRPNGSISRLRIWLPTVSFVSASMISPSRK